MFWKYEYKVFDGAPELTQKSKTVGNLTAWPFYVFGSILFVGPIIMGLLTAVGLDEGAATVIGMVGGALLLRYLLRKLRDNTNAKLQQKYIAKLNVLRDTDPAEYMRIVQNLQRGK